MIVRVDVGDHVARVRDLLRIHLQLAVPARVPELRRLPRGDRKARAEAAADLLASRGDVFFRPADRSLASSVFRALVDGIACAALMPGGVEFMGLRFEDVYVRAARR